MLKLIKNKRKFNHTMSHFTILATGKSRGPQKMGGGEAGTQTELG